jgi:hypothetical protein
VVTDIEKLPTPFEKINHEEFKMKTCRRVKTFPLGFSTIAKSTITHIAMVRNCKVISENINVQKSALN